MCVYLCSLCEASQIPSFISLWAHYAVSYYLVVLYLELQPYRLTLSRLAQVHRRAQFNTSRSHKDTFFISYWSRNIFITLSGVSGQAESVERTAEGERGHVEPDRDTGMTLWHVKIPSTELCLAQQHETRKWATNVTPDPPSYCVHTCTNTMQTQGWDHKTAININWSYS